MAAVAMVMVASPVRPGVVPYGSLSSSSLPSQLFCSRLRFSQSLGPATRRAPSTVQNFRLRLAASTQEGVTEVPQHSVSVILLAGGVGKRMEASMPKQYLPLMGQPIALHSFRTFASMDEVMEITVVCDPSYRSLFEEAGQGFSPRLKFALPGKERQDSVYSGLQEISGDSDLVCVHDSARPLVLARDVQKVLADARIHGAAVLGVRVKPTIKQARPDKFVLRTLDRSTLWEMQTPQVIEPSLLRKGFDYVRRMGLEVTDDVSIVEHLGHPVFITEGSYTNLKVTTPDDLLVAERILHASSPAPAAASTA